MITHRAFLDVLPRAAWVALCVLALMPLPLSADDWPQFRGEGRRGVWSESGILETFPADGLTVKWRTPVGVGYAGPAVSDGRVFVVDFTPAGTEDPEDALPDAIGRALSLYRGTERALALDEDTGRVLWTQSWPVDYAGIMWAVGPRATPTVDGDRVYVLGATGQLLALRTTDGEILWRKHYEQDYGADRTKWAWDYGFVSAPIVDGDRVICMVGGAGDAMVVAFERSTGQEVWRALPSDGGVDLGVAQPVLIEAGGTTQLIVWLPEQVYSLDPNTGSLHWEQPFHVYGSMTVPTPIVDDDHLFFTNFYNGPLMLELDRDTPTATVLWKGTSESEIRTDGLHGVVTTPVMIGDHIYGICSYGQFRCLRIATGERIWETFDLTQERARWASGQIIRHGDRLFVNTDRGDLVIVAPSPTGYQEISRTPLIKPTSPPYNRRELELVNWSHPAYANRHVYARNDEELIAASLAAPDEP